MSLTSIFRAYLSQLQGNDSLSILEGIQVRDLSLPEVAAYLFVLMEGFEGENFSDEVEYCISYLVDNWALPSRNLWGDKELVYVSNLGMVYGALNSAKRVTKRYELQKELTAIRDYVFANVLSGGMLVCSPDKREVSTDLLVTVMPFGLFSPQDLVMVAAVREMEERLVSGSSVFQYRGDSQESPVSSAWLAWYFVEKGEIKKAREYQNFTRVMLGRTADELAEVISQIVGFYLDLSQEIEIIHAPYGNNNEYYTLPFERKPRDPEVDELVRARVSVLPDFSDLEVFLRVNTSLREFMVDCYRVDDVWEGVLGSFSLNEEVEYSFVALRNGVEVGSSERYSFKPYGINSIVSVEFFAERDNIVWLKGYDSLGIAPVYLGLGRGNQGIKFSLRFDGVLPGSPRGCFEDEESIVIDELGCRVNKEPFNISVGSVLEGYSEVYPVLQWWTDGEKVHQVRWNFRSPLGERFFGFGERYNDVEQRGNELECYVYNQYRDQGIRTYIPVPFFISSRGYGLYLDTAFLSTFGLGSGFDDLLSLTSRDGSLSFYLFLGEPKEVLQQFIGITGSPVLPPVWAFGPWMSSNNWDRDSVVRAEVEKTNALKIPATVLVIEQWSDEATYYIFNDAEYPEKSGSDSFGYEDFSFPEWGRWPDPKGLIDYLHENSLRVILWQIPIEKYLNRQSHVQKDNDERFMIDMGYCVKRADGTPYRIPEDWFKESLLMDFSNPEGKKWWFDKRRYLLEIGVDGFKTDGGEFVFTRGLRFFDGRTEKEMRNLYPNDYVKAYYDFASEDRDALTFSRAGYTGAQNFPAHWAGDERSTFSAFKRSLIAGLSSGMSGIPFWSWDLAGFNGDIPSAELFVRSAEMAAFCPIMQYHAESKGEFNQDRTPWNIAERTGDIRALEGYRFYANVRMNLLPYIYDQALRTSESGIPLMRALFLEYPDDPRSYSIYDQYLFGDSLLVAPVIEESMEERMVYFPEGSWVNIWSNEIVSGPSYVRVKAPLMSIPVYARVGSVMLTNCDSSLELGSWVGNDVSSYTVPVLRVYPEDSMVKEVRDHLGQEWLVKASYQEGSWHISVDAEVQAIVGVPEVLVDNQVLINGFKASLRDGWYWLDLKGSI